MSKGHAKTVEENEKIIKIVIDRILWGGEQTRAVANDLQMNENDLYETVFATKAAKLGKTDEIVKRLERRNNQLPCNLVRAAYNAIGADMPEQVEKAIETKEKAYNESRVKNLTEANEKRKEANEKRSEAATPLWAQTMLLNQAKIISQLDELMDAVIPKYARDIVESNEKLDTHLVQLINKLS